MRKYFYVFSINLQNVLQRRSSLLMDRIGGIATLLTLYYFWVSLLAGKTSFIGYSRVQMLSYVLLIDLLRSFVFTGRGWELVSEISSGRISSFLLRPIRYQYYALALDLSQKTIHVASALFEIGLLVFILKAPMFFPSSARSWLLFLLSVSASSLLYFMLEFLVASAAFWTSESGGPLYCFDLFLQFSAGLFFPLDVLPRALQTVLHWTPFPYLVFFPIRIFLERSSSLEAVKILSIQGFWLAALALAVSVQWKNGLKNYTAEGG